MRRPARRSAHLPPILRRPVDAHTDAGRVFGTAEEAEVALSAPRSPTERAGGAGQDFGGQSVTPGHSRAYWSVSRGGRSGVLWPTCGSRTQACTICALPSASEVPGS